MMQYPLLAALHELEFNKNQRLEDARQPGEDIALYLNRTSIRNDHRRR
jgi:hypothetical protein